MTDTDERISLNIEQPAQAEHDYSYELYVTDIPAGSATDGVAAVRVIDYRKTEDGEGEYHVAGISLSEPELNVLIATLTEIRRARSDI